MHESGCECTECVMGETSKCQCESLKCGTHDNIECKSSPFHEVKFTAFGMTETQRLCHPCFNTLTNNPEVKVLSKRII